MLNWSQKRQLIILIGVFLVIGSIIGTYLFFTLYEEPTCFDGKKNGDEKYVDCGGSCLQICGEDVESPIVLWTRSFKVVDGVYSAVAYIENANREAEVNLVSYKMTIYDNSGRVIIERTGLTSIPANKRFAVFEGNITVDGRIPSRVDFEFTENMFWQKSEEVRDGLMVRSKTLRNEEVLPRIDAVIENDSIQLIEDIEVVAIVYDSLFNAVGASRTEIDRIMPDRTESIVFTWPAPFETAEEVCETPVDVGLVLDRSGSMAFDNENPPEPLTSAKNAAELFVDRLKNGIDQVSVVSFATNASEPIDQALTSNLQSVKTSIDRIAIGTGGIQNTNIFAGLSKSFEELQSEKRNLEADPVIVLLTDGVPTHPENPEFAEQETVRIANEIKANNIELFVIGLGMGVNTEFLEGIASSPDHFFHAFGKEDLEVVYNSIATDICRRGPRVIEIITRIVPQLL